MPETRPRSPATAGDRPAAARPAAHPSAVLLWAATCAIAVLAGCANTIQTQTLATGSAQVSAYALSGPDPVALRSEAARLCAGSGEVLRESLRTQDAAPPASAMQRWWLGTVQLLDPPQREAQLVVRCDLRPQADRLVFGLGPTRLAEAEAPPPPTRGRERTERVAPAAASRGSARAPDAGVPYGY